MSVSNKHKIPNRIFIGNIPKEVTENLLIETFQVTKKHNYVIMLIVCHQWI